MWNRICSYFIWNLFDIFRAWVCFNVPNHKDTAIASIIYYTGDVQTIHTVERYEWKGAAELATKRERAQFGRRRAYVRARANKQRARKAPIRGGCSGGSQARLHERRLTFMADAGFGRLHSASDNQPLVGIPAP